MSGKCSQRLRQHVDYLAGEIGERHPAYPESLERSRHYIEVQFREMGYEIGYDEFPAGETIVRNVIVEAKSKLPSSRLFIIGAHYDSVLGSPGADDNASGVASLIELARQLREVELSVNFRLIAFVLEEAPFFGSSSMGSLVHARKCRQGGENLIGMASLEMVGYFDESEGSQKYPWSLMKWIYPDRGNFIAVAGNFRSRRLVLKLSRLLARAGRIPVEYSALPYVPGVQLSDHWAFWEEGYPAVIITDTAFFRNPHYHLETDLPGTLNYRRMEDLVACLTRMASELR